VARVVIAMFARIANILGWLGVALVLAGLASCTVNPDRVPLRQGLALAGLVCILIYAVSQWREMAATMAKRQTRYGALSIASIVIVLGLLVGVNHLAKKYSKRWDLSAGRDFTLSDQTRSLIASLKEPLSFRVYARPDAMQAFENRLSEYARLSSLVKVEYLDFDREKPRASQDVVRAPGTIVVEYQRRIERITTTADEQEVTGAIVKAVQGRQRKLYFLIGHDEKDLDGQEPQSSYSLARQWLQRDNITCEPLTLAQHADVPADGDVVVIAGPTRDYDPTEIDQLRRYLNRGGKLLIMLDPPARTDSAPLANLIGFVAEWGIKVGNDVVFDLDLKAQAPGRGPLDPIVSRYGRHPITQHFTTSQTMFSVARSVAPAENATRTAQPLIFSSETSWAETDFKELTAGGRVGPDGTERRGNIEIGSVIALPAPDAPPAPAGQTPPPPRPETRLVVIGDSDFAANDTLPSFGNRDFLGNVVNWLAEQENLIAIRPKPPQDRRVELTTNQFRFVALLVLVLVPGSVIGLGVYTWWRRRG
jgi:ABC-type uncharacterized transport system involved in gliding motility auxiliary subunit